MQLGRTGSGRARRGSSSSRGTSPSRGRGRGGFSSSSLGNALITEIPDAFEKDRLENAAKREQRGQTSEATTHGDGRGSRPGKIRSKTVRFASPPTQQTETAGSGNPTSINATGTSLTSTKFPFGTPSASLTARSLLNPFATASTPVGVQRSPTVFGDSTAPSDLTFKTSNSNPFAAPQSSSVYRPLSSPDTNTPTSNPFANQQSSSVFGASPSLATPSIFANTTSGARNVNNPSPFGNTNGPKWNSYSSSRPPISNPFSSLSGLNSIPSGTSSTPVFSGFVTPPVPSLQNTGVSRTTPPNTTSNQPSGGNGTLKPAALPFGGSSFTAPGTNLGSLSEGGEGLPGMAAQIQPYGSNAQPTSGSSLLTAGSATKLATNTLASDIDTLLRKNGITPPSWPTPSPVDPREKAALETFMHDTQAYRAKVRTCLVRHGYLDEPGKAKKLSEAIDFKGTCEEMCPEFEKVTRIVEHNVQTAEKDLSPDGRSYWPSLPKMVKALARSSAGQDAPLPEDVRSPAALRRTLDYLIDGVLGMNDLSPIHGFLWDRTRAIRRDFVFQQFSMTSQELVDQVYCLELITRFHVVALHQMSHKDINEEFSEQQEIEQLGKALLSLIHAYEDCMSQRITCENEAEFRAYYVLLNSGNTGISETVQDWGWKYWGESDEIRTAVNLVETLQNVWDMQGPLSPYPPADIAQNGYSRYFSIIEDVRISYTMACFAEIHFNKVRKAALKSIISAYRMQRQKQQTNAWSLEKLNMYLHFDDEEDIISFGEAYQLHFIKDIGNQVFLSLESDNSMMDPFPALKQPYSHNLVERKRGYHSLPEVIRQTVFEESGEKDDAESLFVPMSPAMQTPISSTMSRPPILNNLPDFLNRPPVEDTTTSATTYKPLNQLGHELEGSTESPTQGSILPAMSLGQTAVVVSKDPDFTASSDLKQESAEPRSAQWPETSSVFDKISATPRTNFLSFLDQAKTNVSAGTPTAESSLFRPAETKQNSAGFVPPPPPTTKPTESPKLFATSSSSPSASAFGNLNPASSKKKVTFNLEPSKQTILKQDVGPDAIHAQQDNSHREGVDDQTRDKDVNIVSPQLLKFEPPGSQMAALAKWIAVGRGGILEDFTEISVERILKQTVRAFIEEEKRRHSEQEERRSREEATRFRYNSLATKYFHKWREIAHHLWLRRKGRLARDARRKMAEGLRMSKSKQHRDVVQDFKASGGPQRRSSEFLLPDAQSLTGASHQVHRVEDLPWRSKISSLQPLQGTPNKSSKHQKSPSQDSPARSKHKHDEPQDLLRRSLLSDSAYLQGGSRIHLMSKYGPKTEGRRQSNGVATDYFRLKARGIMTLPNGTPLANTAAVHLLPHKRSLDNITTPSTPQQVLTRPISSSVPAKVETRENGLVKVVVERDNDVEALKSRARALMAKNKEKIHSSRKRLLDNDDEELFAKAKRIRDQMDEGADWFKSKIRRSLSQSSS